MINVKYFLFYSFLCIGLFSCAQSKYAIKNIYATYTVHLPGNVALDRDGNTIAPRDTMNEIYIETASGEIQWNMAWKNNKAYSIVTDLITTSSLDAGTNKMTNEKMVLHVSKGNKLWRLRLIPEEKNLPAPSDILPGEIMLQGIYHGKKIMQKITRLVELIAMPSA